MLLMEFWSDTIFAETQNKVNHQMVTTVMLQGEYQFQTTDTRPSDRIKMSLDPK
jgi:hypothetical protein